MLPDPDTTAFDESWPGPVRAMWWLKKGGFKTGPEWEKAHLICQEDEGDAAHAWVHALVHWVEGDEWNSNYWYRSAGKQRLADAIEAEWNAVAAELTSTLGA